MAYGIFLEASLHGVLKQLFVMIQISKDVEILQVVWNSLYEDLFDQFYVLFLLLRDFAFHFMQLCMTLSNYIGRS